MALLKKTPIREGRYVNLCVDVAFKRVFAQPVNKDILIALLGTVLPALHPPARISRAGAGGLELLPPREFQPRGDDRRPALHLRRVGEILEKGG